MIHLYKYIALFSAFLLVAIIKSSPLENQFSFILAVLILFAVIYIITQKRKQTFNSLFSGNAIEIFFVSTIILCMIETTGGARSPLYFLNYFLLFGLPLISTPIMSLLFSAGIILFSIPDLIRNLEVDLILRLGSILLLLPLAYFLSNELARREVEKQNQKEAAEEISRQARELEAETDDLEQREKLDDIIESAEELENKS